MDRPAAALAIDIGGSGIRAALVHGDGAAGKHVVRKLDKHSTRSEVEAAMRAAMRAALRSLPAVDGPVGVAIPAFAGDDGRVFGAANLPGLDGIDVGAVLERPATVVPDLAAAATAEARLGTGRGVRRFLCVALGTGVNAQPVTDGRLIVSAYGCFGDAGHVIVEPDGPRCGCGGHGCLEAVASGLAMARDGAAHGWADGEAVIAAAARGEAAALRIVDRAGVALGRAICTWAAITFAQRVAIAGGLAAAGELLLAPARAEVARIGSPALTGAIEIVPAALGANATLIGAGLIALDAA